MVTSIVFIRFARPGPSAGRERGTRIPRRKGQGRPGSERGHRPPLKSPPFTHIPLTAIGRLARGAAAFLERAKSLNIAVASQGPGGRKAARVFAFFAPR